MFLIPLVSHFSKKVCTVVYSANGLTTKYTNAGTYSQVSLRGDCERVTWYALAMDDKKKTYEHVGIDVEVEDGDSFASSDENGGVRGKNGLYFVCQ